MECGIPKDDMEFAFERHATSKIRNADDLQLVKSMGFRGEALASIAAISNIEMISKTNEDEIGTRIVVEAGKILQKEEHSSQTGTAITVNNLFFNTPVRYKFLKKDFTCIWNGSSVWQTEGGSVDCHYKAEMILRPTEPDCIGKKLLDPLKKNPFMTKEAITDFYEHEIQDYLDDEFERYCT